MWNDRKPVSPDQRPASLSAVDGAAIKALAVEVAQRRPVLFLDYDGTLTPIVIRPDAAKLHPDMRGRVQRLAAHCPVAVISGRDLEDVRALVGLPGLIYAGSHGLDIDAPSGRALLGEPFRPALERAIARLQGELASVPGALVQPKRYAVTVHTREVEPGDKPIIHDIVRAVLGQEPELRYMAGKEVHELRPAFDWDKGKAIRHLLDTEGMSAHYPVFIGDDVTDEDGFRAVKDIGLGIRVAEEPASTAAQVTFPNIPSVGAFLDHLADALGQLSP